MLRINPPRTYRHTGSKTVRTVLENRDADIIVCSAAEGCNHEESDYSTVVMYSR
jgi:hypothetical protein